MILDKHMAYFTTDGSETLGGHTSMNSDYMDTGKQGALDGHKKIYLNLTGGTKLTGDSSPKIVVQLASGSDGSTFATKHITTAQADTVADAKIPLPAGIGRYMRIETTITGSPTAGGAFKAFLSID